MRFRDLGLLLATLAGVAALTVAAGPAIAARAGVAGTDTGACFAHVIGGLDKDYYDVYTGNCTGHDEPELDPVSSAPHSAWNLTWRVVLPAGGTAPVSSTGPTFWFGGAVADSNPAKLGGQGFLELQIYPDSLVKRCTDKGGFIVHQQVGTYTACSPVWTLTQQFGQIKEPAAFNGMLTASGGTGPFVMHGRDVVNVHIWAPSMHDAYREQINDETTGQTSDVLVLNSPTDGPLTPAFDTNEIGNALDWGIVWDTPMSFVYEIGHSDLYDDHPGQFCVPGQKFCGSFNHDNWSGQQPLRILDVTFGDGSHPENWAAVSDTGGKAEVLGTSWVGPTKCDGYGGPFCIYPWFTWDGGAFNYGVTFPNTTDNFGRANQFAQQPKCPEDGVFSGPTYCTTILR
ncbi:MAG: hypothetical protein C5B48_01055 [Candidatus Rokuibacteriota bacterium]|nr:MAG: hypothetical protein C5B48_01055 [Candidatus Rokubacteria bacterium]